MNKKTLIIIMILFFTTGCTCEYNLTINENNYSEKITLIAENSEEIKEFDNKWNIPVDKDEYEMISQSDSNNIDIKNVYNYKLSNSNLILNYDFSKSNYDTSTAASICYKKLTFKDYEGTTIISTSEKNNCFDKYPPLTNIKVKIVVDREVISNNADEVNGKTYIWNITKDNANDKSINLVLKNDVSESSGSENNKNTSNKNSILNQYALYIFLAVLVLIIYLVYKWFMNFKEKNNKID